MFQIRLLDLILNLVDVVVVIAFRFVVHTVHVPVDGLGALLVARLLQLLLNDLSFAPFAPRIRSATLELFGVMHRIYSGRGGVIVENGGDMRRGRKEAVETGGRQFITR